MKSFKTPPIERKFSLRASATGALVFDDERVPEANLLPGYTVGLEVPLNCLTQALRYHFRGDRGGSGLLRWGAALRKRAVNLWTPACGEAGDPDQTR